MAGSEVSSLSHLLPRRDLRAVTQPCMSVRLTPSSPRRVTKTRLEPPASSRESSAMSLVPAGNLATS